jgi:hypothetical protein
MTLDELVRESGQWVLDHPDDYYPIQDQLAKAHKYAMDLQIKSLTADANVLALGFAETFVHLSQRNTEKLRHPLTLIMPTLAKWLGGSTFANKTGCWLAGAKWSEL